MIILSTEKDEIRLSLGKTIKEKEDWLIQQCTYLIYQKYLVLH